jgi:hypothetical protein
MLLACLALAVVLAAAPAAAAEDEAPPPPPAPRLPSFALPNLLALGMSLTLLAIACKRFRRE